jgi:adenylylsulfate kinase-like enzyme
MKEKHTVFVRVAGVCGTGKTTIAVKLGRALKALGIDAEVWEHDNSWDNLTDEEVERNLKALAPKISVVIQTEQMNRHVL